MRHAESRRRWLLGGAIGVSLIAALAFGLAPAARSVFSYEVTPASAGGADQLVASLALAPAMEPETLDLRLSCESAAPPSTFRTASIETWLAPQSGAVQSPLPFATLDHFRTAVVVVGGGQIGLTVAGEPLISVPVAHRPGCVARVMYADGSWRVSVSDTQEVSDGPAPFMADVAFEGPAASSVDSVLRVEAGQLGSSPSIVQYVLLTVSLLSLIVAARALVLGSAVEASPDPRRSTDRRSPGGVGPIDVGVAAMLVVWAIIVPVAFDDGWLFANAVGQDPFSGGDVFFQQGLATFLWGYWVGLIQHLWFGVSSGVVLARVPNVLVGLGTWIGLRSIAQSLHLRRRGPWLWVMATVFVVGYGAWGMTFRYEAIVAALFVVSLALALKFADGERRWVLVAWPVVVALAVNAHPTGLVTVAPVLVTWRSIRAWAARDRTAAVAVVGMLATVGLLLFSWDSNLATQLDGFSLLRSGTHRFSVFDELLRYRMLDIDNVLRRMTVVAMLVGVAVFFMRRYARPRGRERRVDIPVWSLIVAFVLMALIPSKHTWHFGALIGVGAVAVALALSDPSGEADDASSPRRGFSAPMVAVLIVGISWGLAWAWLSTEPWALFDLRVQRWWEGAGNILPVSLGSPFTWLGIAAVLAGFATWRLRRGTPTTWSLDAALVAVSAGLAVLVVVATFAVDAVRTDGWTLAGSNVQVLLGAPTCALADDIRVPVAGSLRGLEIADAQSPDADTAAREVGFKNDGGFASGAFPRSGINATLPIEEMPQVGSWLGGADAVPEAGRGGYYSPWYSVSSGVDVVTLALLGGVDGVDGNAAGVQWGTLSGPEVQPIGIDVADTRGRFGDWSLAVFEIPAGADRVRLVVRDEETGSGLRGWIASSHPLGMSMTSARSAMEDSNRVAFVTPALYVHLACLVQPVGGDPRMATPDLMFREIPTSDDYVVWSRGDRAAPMLASAAVDRYFSFRVPIPPKVTGDAIDVLVRQDYLTGEGARREGGVHTELADRGRVVPTG